MRLQPKSGQRGMSFFTLILVIALLAGAGVLAAQAFPTVLEYQAVLKAVNKASQEGNTVPEVQAVFYRAAQIDDITSIKPKDLIITKEGDKIVVAFAYEKEIHMFGPAWLLLKYSGRSR